MPKQTFFNLPEEKQEALIHASRKEFSRVSLHEASISNIIKTCGISRGSFYQYFQDKEDAFYYLLKQHSKKRQENFISHLKEYDGDLFIAVTVMFESKLREFKDEENRAFFKNIFLNMNHKIQDTFTRGVTEDRFNDHFNKIRKYINTEKLDVSSEQELFHAFHLMMMVMFNNLIQHFAKGLSVDTAFENFNLEMGLLKKGLFKEENQ